GRDDLVARTRPGQLFERPAASPDASRELAETREASAALALCHQLAHLLTADVLDVAEAQAHAALVHRALDLRCVHVEAQDRDAPVLGLVHEAVRRIEAHRL